MNHVGLLPGDLQLRNRECASSQIADIPRTVFIGKSPGRAGMDVAIDSHLIGTPLKRLQYLYNRRGLANGSRHICNGEIPDGPDLIAHFDCLNSCGQIRAQRRAARKRHLVESLLHSLELPHQHEAIEENESAITVVVDGLAEVCFFFLALVSEELLCFEFIDAALNNHQDLVSAKLSSRDPIDVLLGIQAGSDDEIGQPFLKVESRRLEGVLNQRRIAQGGNVYEGNTLGLRRQEFKAGGVD